MIRCASIYTYEVDDPQVALTELRSQLDEKLSLLEHSVGIIMCHPEFTSTDVLKYVADNLPFDVAGVTTSSQAVNGEVGDLMLTIFVITSDDVCFRAGVTGSLEEEIDAPTKAAYDIITQGIEEEPKLAFVFPPLLLKYAGDSFVNAWGKIIPATPVYGTIAIDDTIAFDQSETVYNGVTSKTSMVFVLCYGNINPRFIVGTLPDDKVLPYKGEITSSEGPLVHKINNMNAYDYFHDIGLVSDKSSTDNFLFVPFMIDLRKRKDYDGVPVMRVLTTFTESGTAIFRGNVDENSIFNLSRCTQDDVNCATAEIVERINTLPDVHGVILFSCIIRQMVQGTNPLLEAETIKDKISPQIPFMMGYAGGEICPTSVKSGAPTNRFHNYSLIILVI